MNAFERIYIQHSIFQVQIRVREARANPHQGEAFQVRGVPQGVQQEVQPEGSHAGAQR